jgi:hypothetical protein
MKNNSMKLPARPEIGYDDPYIARIEDEDDGVGDHKKETATTTATTTVGEPGILPKEKVSVNIRAERNEETTGSHTGTINIRNNLNIASLSQDLPDNSPTGVTGGHNIIQYATLVEAHTVDDIDDEDQDPTSVDTPNVSADKYNLGKNGMRNSCIIAAAAMIIGCSIIGIVMWITSQSPSNSSIVNISPTVFSSQTPSRSSSSKPSSHPSTSSKPSSHPSTSPTNFPTSAPSTIVEGKIGSFLEDKLKIKGEKLKDDSTSYGKMYDWLRTDPKMVEMITNPKNDSSAVERSVLSLIFFSLTDKTSFKFCAPYEEGMSLNENEDEENCYHEFFDYETNQEVKKLQKRWLSNTDYCLWAGVTCTDVKYYEEEKEINSTILTRIDLRAMGLSGTIPTEIGLLKELTLLDLQGFPTNNDVVRGTIPSEIGHLERLGVLRLAGNEISGKIPDQLYNLLSLQIVNIGFNEISGQISSEIGQLKKLVAFAASNNNLSGTIPTNIGKLNEVQAIYLSHNLMNGSLPSEIGKLNYMNVLFLANCSLSGSLPSEIGNLSQMSKCTRTRNVNVLSCYLIFVKTC